MNSSSARIAPPSVPATAHRVSPENEPPIWAGAPLAMSHPAACSLHSISDPTGAANSRRPSDTTPQQTSSTALSLPLREPLHRRAHGSRGRTQVHLQHFAQQYHLLLQQPRVYRPQTVFLFAIMTGAGKFLAAYGAYLAAEQFNSDHPRGGAVGCVLGAAGAASFLYGASKFSQAVARIDSTIAKAVKTWAIVGGGVLIGAYTCKGLFASDNGPKSLGFDMLGRSLNWAGVTMMGFSFPVFVACSQAVYGNIIVNRWQRLFVGWCLLTALSNIAPLIPSSRRDSDAQHIGTQLAGASASFGALLGAGFVLSSAWESLGAPQSET